jgi:ABC-2 type transport system permease protein
MIVGIRTELRKLRTTRMTWGLLGLAGVLTLLVTSVESAKEGGKTGSITIPSLSTAAGLRDILTNTGFAILVAMVLGTIVASGEFRHRTATDTYLDEPNRTRVLAAKIIAGTVAGAACGLLAATVASGVALAFVAAKGYHVALPAGTFARYAAGAALAAALMAAVGVGIGSLVRGQIAAIIAVFAWGLGIEQIVGGLSRPLAAYLPVTAAGTLAGASNEAAMPPVPSGLHPLPAGAVAALLAGIAVVITALAARTTVQRDIS